MAAEEPADILLLVPFFNEAAVLPDLLKSLEWLAYPMESLTIVLVDDASTDSSTRIARDWVVNASNRYFLVLEENMGKAVALNDALRHFSQGDLVAVFDADERPQPNVLKALVQPFADKRVGAVSGFRAVSNPLASPIASHAALESLVHQLVTMQAKERLVLAPAVLGSNCVYRRKALAEVGFFLPGALLEDSDLTLKLARTGWRIHFVAEAISYHAVPQTMADYWWQHRRWATGFQSVAQQQAFKTLRARNLSWSQRCELVAFSLGYIDRVALLLAGGLIGAKAIILGRRTPFLLGVTLASLITPLFQVIVALHKNNAPAAVWRRTAWLPIFLLVDVVLALVSLFWRAPAWSRRQEEASAIDR